MVSFSILIEHMLTKVLAKFCGDTSVSFEVKHRAIHFPKRAFFYPEGGPSADRTSFSV